MQRPQGPFARIVPVQKGYCAQTPAGEVTCWKGFEQAPNVKPPPFEGRYEEIVALEAALCGRDAQGVLSCIGGAQQTPQRLADGNAAIYGGSLGVCGITARGAWCSERAWLQHQLTTGAPGDRWRRHLPGAYVEARNDGLGMCARQADGLTRCARFKQPGSAFTLEGRYTRMVVGDGLCLQRSDQV